MIVRAGVKEQVARLLAATPSLRLSWPCADAVAIAFTTLSTQTGHADRPAWAPVSS